MKKTRLSHRMLSVLLCVALLMSYIPVIRKAAAATLSKSAVTGTVTDPGTAYTFEHMMGTDIDGNRYAGRMWVDKSVYKDGDTAVLNSKGAAGSSFEVALAEGEAFQIIFSALGSTMTSKETISATGPLDVVLVLDTSTSMDDEDRYGVTRLERTIAAANGLLDDLLMLHDVRIAIVTYNEDSETVLALDKYTNGIDLVVTDYYNNGSSDAGVVTAYDNYRQVLGKDDGYTQGTNLQSGIDRGFNVLANAADIDGRMPVAIVLTDGQANRASQEGFYELSDHNDKNGTSASNRNLYMSTLLNAAYNKTKIEEHYGKDATVYTVGVDVSGNTVAQLLMNPADSENGFHNHGNGWSKQEITAAYTNFQRWAAGQTVTQSGWTFDHGYPKQNGVITAEKIAANIYYADTYYDVSNADLEDTFQQIYEELSSGVFNPITSSSSVSGGTGVDDTPLIYVDFIGKHMEVKEIQTVTLFGASYGVQKKADSSYTVTEATGTNPTTNERWNTAEDIRISVTEQADGTQKLEIRINQEILPIILEQVIAETVGGVSKATITEYTQDPLRVYYTVGVDSDILLPGGEVDVSKLQGYEHIDDASGTVSFYSNQFGIMNPADNAGVAAKGDAHVGFQPSPENRYYYHQANQGIFTKISNKNGSPVTIPENNEYGIVWNEAEYDLSWMTYTEYQNAQPEDKVYTYVTYYRPTSDTTDAANAAEEITYLVYTDWKYLKESVAFYDAAAKVYLNGGKAVSQEAVESTVAAYKAENPGAEIYAVLGIGSRRTSRLHNMMVDKLENSTQTAAERYTPEYLENKSEHNDNDVVVWLGNNGKLTVSIETGIALSKAVTEPFGNADDTYALTVSVPAGVAAAPVVVDEKGSSVASTYENNVLTVNVKAGQTVYISGIPGGTVCEIGEIVDGDYYVESKTDTVRIPLVSEVLSGAVQFVPAVVTNAPNRYGNLFVTKEITSDHAVPESVLDTEFSFTVNVGTALSGKTFTVEDSAHAAPYSVTVDNDGNLVFLLKARQTVEILNLPEGTAVTVTEATPDSHFAVSYRTRNHSGEDADEDNALVIPANGNATAVVLNHYTPTPVSVDMDIVINKEFADANVADRLSGGEFRFRVEKYDPDTQSWTVEETASVSYGANEYGEKSVTVADVLKDEVYTQVGTYSYRVSEVKGEVANVSYDRTVYTFDVVVTDQDGQLAATVIGMNNEALADENSDGRLDYITTFVNTYETAPVSMDVTKQVINKSGDTTVSAQGFRFQSMAVDQDGNPLGSSENIVFSDAAGEARISGYYTREQIGTHYYIVYEEDTGKPGWSYSGAQYFVTVVVAEDPETGKLSATMTIAPWNEAAEEETAPTVTDNNKGQMYFTNTYDPENASIDLDGSVFKVLTGKTLEEGQFTFHVYKDGQRTDPIITGTNKSDGNVHFVDFDKALTFSGVGKYQYDVVEEIPSGAVYDEAAGKYVLGGMYYDPTIFDLVVEVVNDESTGKLIANAYFEDAVNNTVTFRNSYRAASTEYALGGVKILHGRAPRNGEFAFELYEGDTLLQTVTNQADGSFRFQAVSYNQPGTYTYTIKEKSGDVAGVSYDGVDKPVTVKVTVTDEDGVLRASANKENADIQFENTYNAAAARVTFNGAKELVGGTLEDNAFTFQLYRTDNSFDITGGAAELLDTARNENGAFAFTRSLKDTGTYYFVIVEDTSAPAEGIVYDRTRHTFAVQVSDSGDGQLKAVVTNMITGVSSAAAASVSTGVKFTNAVADEATEKEVYLEGTTTEIDGKKVSAGDVLSYFITYTNYTGENVVLDIMDTIPSYTTYVEGSASHGGTYAGTHLNWILSVAKGESVTVSFNVRVDEEKAVVPNTAVVRDGVNTYHTNEVVNHTVENELEKDVFSPADVTVSIDGEKVYEGDTLLYRISFTNTTREAIDLKITDNIPVNTTYVAGSADQGGVYENGVIVWNLNSVPAWETVAVTFQVTVNENIGAATVRNQATASDGTNLYETEWVTNYTVVDEVKKEVFQAKEPAVNIDGQAVKQGDTLIYAISYKNTAAQRATVTITDSIPQHTTYVAGSADHGGVYEAGKITWTLEAEAGATVTVTFKVKVNEVRSATLTNQAQVLEGRNAYTTNEVSNPTNNPGDPTNPQTGDNTNLQLWIALLFVSGGGVVATSVYGKKKKETENN